MKQNELVLDYLKKHGRITALDAFHIGILRLSARIYDLRAMGVPIIRMMETHVNRDGSVKRWAVYYLDTRRTLDS